MEAVWWLLAAACGGSGGESSATRSAGSAAATASCNPQPSSQSGPVPDPSGPFFHQVAFATTGDGITLQNGQQVIDHASVPDGTRLPDGRIGIYYVNGSDGVRLYVCGGGIESDTSGDGGRS